ncbi:phosphonate ABC transporter ATP-binding protein [Halalkalibacter urbisdiaboli]|uniref:phosphonate ABC transporter ATP-binding protein n=1 Tax=Halalkalibacter urbisdiaboli TaxID=1960589 RepID=UPI000B432844|nr:phosphonate ABC transporter ATP-binding protein [Halalkalibacter urbisdiaboli]
MLTVSNLVVQYPKSKESAINHLSLSINKGEFVCVLGKSGAGKSTFIRSLNGLQRPTSGSIRWEGIELTSLREAKLRQLRSEIVMIFQHFNLIPRMSVFQNTLTGSFGKRAPYKNIFGLFSAEEKEKAYNVLKQVELSAHAHKRVEALSGGQKQRVGIARALMQEPRMLLGDEPVASLDPSTSRKIFELLKKIHIERELVTIVNVHDVQLAKEFATRIIAFRDGHLVFDDSPKQLTDEMFTNIYG